MANPIMLARAKVCFTLVINGSDFGSASSTPLPPTPNGAKCVISKKKNLLVPCIISVHKVTVHQFSRTNSVEPGYSVRKNQ